MAYNARYTKQFIRQDGALLQRLASSMHQDESTVEPIKPCRIFMENSIEGDVFEQDLLEFLLSNIRLLCEEIELEQVIQVLERNLGDAIIDINDSENKTERAVKLVTHIQNLGKNHVVYKVFESIIAGGCPLFFRDAVRRWPVKEESDFFIGALVEIAKNRLRITNSRKASLHFQSSEQNATNYLNLNIIFDKGETKNGSHAPYLYKNNNGTMHINFNEFLKRGLPTPEGQRLLLKGPSGSGKTKTVEHLYNSWIAGTWDPDYTLVVLLKINSLMSHNISEIPSKKQRHVSLLDIVTTTGLLMIDSPSDLFFISKWLDNWSRNILVLMDGVHLIEQWTNSVQPEVRVETADEPASPSDVCLAILHGTLLPEATVLFTSQACKGLESIPCNTALETKGYSNESINEFIKVQKDQPKEDKKIVKKVLRKNSLAKAACQLPFYCNEILGVLKEDMTILTENALLTKTRIASVLFVSHLKNGVNQEERRGEDLKSMNFVKSVLKSDYFFNLAELALMGLLYKRSSTSLPKTVFSTNDFKEAKLTDKDVARAIKDKLLVPVSFGSSSDDTNQSNTHSVEFTHLSFQEFLAMAVFVARYFFYSDKRKSILSEIFNATDDRFDMAKQFLFGLQFDKENKWGEMLVGGLSDIDVSDLKKTPKEKSKFQKSLDDQLASICTRAKESPQNMELFTLAASIVHECQTDSIYKIVNKKLFEKDPNLNMEDLNITAFTMFGLVSIMNAPISIQTIKIKNTELDEGSMKALCGFLSSNASVHELILTETGNEGLKYLNSMLACNKCIKKLSFERNRIGDNLRDLQHGFSSMKSVISLSLSHNEITEDGMSILAQSLNDQKQLQELHLDGNQLTDEANKALLKCVKNKTKLRILSLRGNTLSGDSCGEIAEILKTCKELERVDLSFNQIGTDGAMEILKNKRQKTFLDLSGNQIRLNSSLMRMNNVSFDENYTGEKKLEITMKKIKSGARFKILNLEGIGLTDENIEKLIDCLFGNDWLVSLNLRGNSLTRSSISNLNRIAFSCLSLKSIDVAGNFLDQLVIESFINVESYIYSQVDNLGTVDEQRLNMTKKTEMVGDKMIPLEPSERMDIRIKDIDKMRLTVLDLSGHEMTSRQVGALSTVLEKNKALKKLELSNCGLHASQLEPLCRALCSGSKLLYLGLSQNILGDDCVPCLCILIKENNFLVSLDLSLNKIGYEGIVDVLKSAEKSERFETLNLSQNQQIILVKNDSRMYREENGLRRESWSPEKRGHQRKSLNLGSFFLIEPSSSTVNSLINISSNLRSLDMSNNQICVDGARGIAQFLETNTTLESLNLSLNKFECKGLAIICESLKRSRSIVSLKLIMTFTGSQECQVLGNFLEGTRSISFLDVSKNGLGSRGMKELGNGLGRNSSLISLNLASNMIGPAGAKDLEASLKGHKNLCILELQSNALLREGTVHILRLIESKSNRLTCVDLSNNGIGDSGATDIGKVLTGNKVLRELYLSKNNIHARGIKDLSGAMVENTHLTVLDLSENWMHEKAALDFIGVMLQKNRTLKKLSLRDNAINMGGFEVLFNALKGGSSLVVLDWTQNPGIDDYANRALHKVFFSTSAHDKRN